jgi:hypothetical protein
VPDCCIKNDARLKAGLIRNFFVKKLRMTVFQDPRLLQRGPWHLLLLLLLCDK